MGTRTRTGGADAVGALERPFGGGSRSPLPPLPLPPPIPMPLLLPPPAETLAAGLLSLSLFAAERGGGRLVRKLFSGFLRGATGEAASSSSLLDDPYSTSAIAYRLRECG